MQKTIVTTCISLLLTLPGLTLAIEDTNDTQSVVFKIPKDANIIDVNAPLRGIVFNNTCGETYQQGVKSPKIKGITFNVDNGSLIVRSLDGIDSCQLNKFHGGFKEYQVTVDADAKSDVTTLSFTPGKTKIKEPNFFSNLGGHKTPEFPVKQLISGLKENATIGYTFEVDSQYNPDSITSNFKRLWKEENGNSVLFNGKRYNKWYRIKLDEDHLIVVFPEVVPYRNGSKAILNMNIPIIANDGNIIDVTSQLARAKKIAADAINN